MARVFDARPSSPYSGAALTPAGGLAFIDPVATRRRGKSFTILAAVLAMAMLGLLLAAKRSAGPTQQALAAGAALCGLSSISLAFMAAWAWRRLPPMLPDRLLLTQGPRRLELAVEQLDDRFSIFRDVSAEGVPIDMLVVGPTGVFAICDSTQSHTDAGPLPGFGRATQQARAATELIARVAPQLATLTESVIVSSPAQERTIQRAEGTGDAPWIVPLDKLAAAFLKRSGQENSITRGVDMTGAFSSKALQSEAIAEALAKHWGLSRRRVRKDYVAPWNEPSWDPEFDDVESPDDERLQVRGKSA